MYYVDSLLSKQGIEEFLNFFSSSLYQESYGYDFKDGKHEQNLSLDGSRTCAYLSLHIRFLHFRFFEEV